MLVAAIPFMGENLRKQLLSRAVVYWFVRAESQWLGRRIANVGIRCSKPLGDFMVDLAFDFVFYQEKENYS